MSKKQAIRRLKRRRMEAEVSYLFHQLVVMRDAAGVEHLGPAFMSLYVRTARKAHYRKELVRP